VLWTRAHKLSGLLELLEQSINDSLDLRKQRFSFHRHRLNGDIADTPFPPAVQFAKKLQISGYVRFVEHMLLTDAAPRPHVWLEMGPHVPPHAGRNRFRFYDLSQNILRQFDGDLPVDAIAARLAVAL
jgi:hypothetical protein